MAQTWSRRSRSGSNLLLEVVPRSCSWRTCQSKRRNGTRTCGARTCTCGAARCVEVRWRSAKNPAVRAKSNTQVSVGCNSGSGLWRMTLSLPKTKRFAASSCWLRKERHVLTCVNKKSEQSGRKEWLDWIRRKKSSCFLFIYLPCIKNWFATDT